MRFNVCFYSSVGYPEVGIILISTAPDQSHLGQTTMPVVIDLRSISAKLIA